MTGIEGSNPVVIPAQPSQTFDVWWVQEFQTFGISPAQKVTSTFVLVPQNSTTGAIDQAKSVRVNVPDLFALIAQDSVVADAFGAVIAALQKIAKDQGRI